MSERAPGTIGSESFFYIGRNGCGTLQIALGVLGGGLLIGLIAGPGARDSIANDTVESTGGVRHAAAQPALKQPQRLCVASAVAEPEPHKPPPEKKRSLKVRNGDTLMSMILSAGVAREEAHGAAPANAKHFKLGRQLGRPSRGRKCCCCS